MTKQFLSSSELATKIDAAVALREPFSFVRLGDGEGLLLGFSALSSLQDYAYLASHFGNHASAADIRTFQNFLIATIDSADVLGIRDDSWKLRERIGSIDPNNETFLDKFRELAPLRAAEKNNINAHDAKRIYLLSKWVAQTTALQDKILTSSWAPVELQLREYWEHLISTQSRIGLLNYSATLASRLARRFGVNVDFIQVPSNAIDPGRWQIFNGKWHLSICWPEIINEIPRDLNGQVYFIAAGLIGKQFTRIVKERGGIALDIGALCDTWDSRATRPLVYQTVAPLTASPYAPPPELLLGTKTSPLANHDAKKTIVLHLGFSKTGTTTIQAALHENERALDAVGARYVHAGRMAGNDINHHQLARAFGSGERHYDQPSPPPQKELLEKLIEQIADEIRSTCYQTYILSSELFTNFRIDHDAEDIFIDWLQSYPMQIVFYVRNQFDWLISWYTQAAKNGNMGLWLDEFLNDPSQIPNSERFDGNFLRKIEYFSRYIPKQQIKVISFDKHKGEHLCSSFLEAVGVNAPDFNSRSTLENVSPSPADTISKVISRRLQATSHLVMRDDDFQSFAEEKMLLGRHQERRDAFRALVAARYRDINEELFRRYGVDIR